LAEHEAELPVQPIHGDLTDDNVTGRPGEDARVHPDTVLDLGDLSLGWRVGELAVTVSSMLHHEPERPLRTLETVRAFHAEAPLADAEARALWPLVVLRAALLVASGWRQLEIDGDNDYARERIDAEQAIFDAATRLPLREMTEHVLVATWQLGSLTALPARETDAPVLPGIADAVLVDLGVESAAFDAGRWLAGDAEAALIAEALSIAPIAVLPYGQFRFTRSVIDADTAAATSPLGTELLLAEHAEDTVRTPVSGAVLTAQGGVIEIETGVFVLRLEGVDALVAPGEQLAAGAELGRVRAQEHGIPRRLRVALFRADAPRPVPELISPDRVPAWRRMCLDPARLLGLPGVTERDEAEDELRRRERIFAAAQERYYERPPQIERGWQHHLVDTTGRSYVDLVNNVTGLGHGHPGVADAVNRQIRVLNTNSRFLYRGLAEYSERLLAMLPAGSGLDTVLLVNSGSEAVDLALRLAQAATGRRTVVALREAYHGWTMASDAVTTSAYDNPDALSSRPDWVHIADVPNRFRGSHRGEDTAPAYLADLERDLERLAAEDRAPAAFICESVLGNAGGVLLPEGYLAGAYAAIRAAGGLAIADEVQVGFGRMGSSFWGFEQSGVLPDIVTIAKPMGNGYPIGGVVTSKRIADALSAQGQFFSSAGGSPVSAQVGLAVLDAMRDEGLQENARVVGDRMLAGFAQLRERHALIGPIHGTGLYLGVELVRDRDTLEPATAEAAAICERLRELGCVVLTTSERSNVLKVKPPLTLTAQSADFLLAQLDRVLTEGW
ncbi:aminotransferase, partial [Leucobacter sp. M11]|uniref:aminotransferase n=1 Tax=Leucobacter sp. M11 TaxID=2993565 RepID=UPI002D80268F